MVIKIIALIIGVLILGTGLYYLSKEKHDPESRKIYGIVSAVGGVVAVGGGSAAGALTGTTRKYEKAGQRPLFRCLLWLVSGEWFCYTG